MKLRGKLVLLETVISLIFFLSLIITVSLLNKTLQYSHFLNEAALLNSHSRRVVQGGEILHYRESIPPEMVEQIWDDIDDFSGLFLDLGKHSTLYLYSDELKEELTDLRKEWDSRSKTFNTTEMRELYSNFQTQNLDKNGDYISLKKTADAYRALPRAQWNNWQRSIIEMDEALDSLLYEIRVNYTRRMLDFQEACLYEVDKARLRRLRNIMIFNIITVMLVALITLLYRNRILNHLKTIITAMEEVAAGDLSARLRIRSNDEFGKLSRDFNTVIEVLWAKLETVQHILEDVGRSISNEIDLDKAEKAIIYLARKNSSADGVALFSISGEDYLQIKHLHGDYRPPFKVGETDLPEGETNSGEEIIESFRNSMIPLEGNILGETAQSGEATFWKDAEKDGTLGRNEDHPFFISSMLNIPLRVGNRVLGVLSLIKNKKAELFSDLEYTNMLSFGELAAISIDNLLQYLEMLDIFELNREIDIAADIQKDLLPQQIPRFPGLDLSISSRTLRGINGDFYDAYLLNSNKLMLVICEVAGKGVPAALVIIMLKTILKLVARPEKPAGQIIQELNTNITERIKIENIATLSLMVLDNQKGTLSYASAGHEPMQVYHTDTEELEEISPHGIPVGLDKTAQYESKELTLDPKNIYLLYTDGVPETRDSTGKVFGTEGIKKNVNKHMKESSERIKTEILDDLSFFQRDTQQWDDQTLMVMRKEEKA